jgi:hypothetical protein
MSNKISIFLIKKKKQNFNFSISPPNNMDFNKIQNYITIQESEFLLLDFILI